MNSKSEEAKVYDPRCPHCGGTGWAGSFLCCCWLNVQAAAEIERFRREERRANTLTAVLVFVAVLAITYGVLEVLQ